MNQRTPDSKEREFRNRRKKIEKSPKRFEKSPKRFEKTEKNERNNWKHRLDAKTREKPKNMGLYNMGNLSHAAGNEPEMLKQHREHTGRRNRPEPSGGVRINSREQKFKGPRYNQGGNNKGNSNNDNEREHFQRMLGNLTENQKT